MDPPAEEDEEPLPPELELEEWSELLDLEDLPPSPSDEVLFCTPSHPSFVTPRLLVEKVTYPDDPELPPFPELPDPEEPEEPEDPPPPPLPPPPPPPFLFHRSDASPNGFASRASNTAASSREMSWTSVIGCGAANDGVEVKSSNAAANKFDLILIVIKSIVQPCQNIVHCGECLGVEDCFQLVEMTA